MDANTGPKMLHTNHMDLGQFRAHEGSGKSPYVLHMRRKDTQGWQMKSRLTAHHAMPQDSLAQLRFYSFTECSPANPFAPTLLLILSPSNFTRAF